MCVFCQPLLLLILQTLVENCMVFEGGTSADALLTTVGIPAQMMVAWLCTFTQPLNQPMRNTLESALDRLVERKLASVHVYL